jgi:hypothetical protein
MIEHDDAEQIQSTKTYDNGAQLRETCAAVARIGNG